MKQSTHQRNPTPDLSPEVAEMAKIAFALLNLRVSDETHKILVAHGMPRDADPTIGNMIEIALTRELPILASATAREHDTWEDWAARILALYKMHTTSKDFPKSQKRKITHLVELAEQVRPPKLPFNRSDFNLLSFSTEIANGIGARAAGLRGSPLGCACKTELDRCAKYFSLISEFALEAGRKLEA